MSTHTNPWRRLSGHLQSPAWPPTLCVVWCLIWWFASIIKRMVIHDTKCAYWDQVKLNNTKLKLSICRKTWTQHNLFCTNLLVQYTTCVQDYYTLQVGFIIVRLRNRQNWSMSSRHLRKLTQLYRSKLHGYLEDPIQVLLALSADPVRISSALGL